MEGTLTGTFNELTTLNGVPLTDEQQLPADALKWGGLEAWGTDMMGPHYAAAWAWAGSCPFRWGERSPPSGRHPRADGGPLAELITEKGASARSSPTASTSARPSWSWRDAAANPRRRDRAAADARHRAFLHTFDDPDAAERHTQQYFEIFGYRAMYKDGWWLAHG